MKHSYKFQCQRGDTKRRLLLLLSLLSMAPFLFGCAGAGGGAKTSVDFLPSQISASGGRNVYFVANDPRYDDKGPGSYIYPFSYNNREGHFDMTRFEVLDGGKNIVFVVSVRRPIPRSRIDGSTEHKGWSDHLIDIYIDKDGIANSGNTRTLPGRNLVFDEKSAWETAILVTPQRSYDIERIIENRTEDLEFVRIRKQIIVPERAYVDGYSFRISVPKSQLGTPKPNWGYQVLLVPFDKNNLSYGNFYNSQVRRFADDTHFGGGSDSFGNPNVIDILAPTEAEQYRILRNYVSSPYAGDNRYATISCIYGGAQKFVSRSSSRQKKSVSIPSSRKSKSAVKFSEQAQSISSDKVVPMAPAAAIEASSEATRYGLRRPQASSFSNYGLNSAVVEPATKPAANFPAQSPASLPMQSPAIKRFPVPAKPQQNIPITSPTPAPAPTVLETHSFDFKL